MSQKPVSVYLDTQDFSRFGDVIRGHSNNENRDLFRELEAMKQSGQVVFPVSMPILSELIQYDFEFRDTAICKAQAVERLCGKCALPHTTRLVAGEISQAVRELGLSKRAKHFQAISHDRYWYPNIAANFEDVRQKFYDELETQLIALGRSKRQARRAVEKEARKLNLVKIAQKTAPAMAREYGLSAQAIERSIVGRLLGNVSAEEASRTLFEEIAEPETLIRIFIERYGNKDALPGWIRDAGQKIQRGFEAYRAQMRPLLSNKALRDGVVHILDLEAGNFGRDVIAVASDDIAEFCVSERDYRTICNHPDVRSLVPATEIVGTVAHAYLKQIMGFFGTPSKVEASFAGDLIHALYLPHVDLWRGDRRFANLIKEAMPKYSSRIVPRPKDLVGAIEQIAR